MRHNAYLQGCDILGADATAPGPQQYVVIRLKDPGALVKKGLGQASGSFAWSLAPQAVTGIVYGELRGKIQEALAKEGADADVTITSSPPTGAQSSGEFVTGLGLGAGIVGLVWLLKRIIVG
jgi:hypothetical protein